MILASPPNPLPISSQSPPDLLPIPFHSSLALAKRSSPHSSLRSHRTRRSSCCRALPTRSVRSSNAAGAARASG